MRKSYAKSWFGIEFESFTKLDTNNLADVSFYDKFYQEFYRRYSRFEELPTKWQAVKMAIADFILSHTDKNTHLLSIGCGIGYIEWLLWQRGRREISVR